MRFLLIVFAALIVFAPAVVISAEIHELIQQGDIEAARMDDLQGDDA